MRSRCAGPMPRRPGKAPTISCSRPRGRSPRGSRALVWALLISTRGLPVAAGLGGGSADAAAALRLLARANNIPVDDGRLYDAARVTGADVPVCLDPRPRLMRGIGEILSAPLKLPALPAVLANPGVALPTKSVFAGWRRAESQALTLDVASVAKIDKPRGVFAASRHASERSRKRRDRRRAGDRAKCSSPCARSPAADWRACRVPAPLALRSSPRQPPPLRRRKL